MDAERVIVNASDHFKALKEHAKDADKICIASFSVYAGITDDGMDWSEEYDNMVHWFLDELDGKKVEILLGMPAYTPCMGICLRCAAKFRALMERMALTAKHWPKYKWRFAEEFHMKAVVFLQRIRDGRKLDWWVQGAVAGGRNLTDSDWTDLSFLMTRSQAQDIYRLFHKLFGTAANVNARNIKRATEAAIHVQR